MDGKRRSHDRFFWACRFSSGRGQLNTEDNWFKSKSDTSVDTSVLGVPCPLIGRASGRMTLMIVTERIADHQRLNCFAGTLAKRQCEFPASNFGRGHTCEVPEETDPFS